MPPKLLSVLLAGLLTTGCACNSSWFRTCKPRAAPLAPSPEVLILHTRCLEEFRMYQDSPTDGEFTRMQVSEECMRDLLFGANQALTSDN